MTSAEPATTHPLTTIATDTPGRAEGPETAVLPFGPGRAVLDAATGAPLQFTDADAPGRTYLLDATTPWHSVEHAWGTGHVVADSFSGRWNAPDSLTWDAGGLTARHTVDGRLAIEVDRRGGETLSETYRFQNLTDRPLRITSLGIQTPFADLYPGALDALTRRVHAHVFTGGSWAWVAAQPMNGAGRVLGLQVTRGELCGYSVETRNAKTISNARGHLVLQVTDRARNPTAFGGQPVITIEPGDEYLLAWEIGWHGNIQDFVDVTAPPARFSALSAPVGQPITIDTPHPVTVPDAKVEHTEHGARVTATEPGSYQVKIGESARTELHFHDTVRDTVRKRAQYVLRYQRSVERPGLLANALVPVDTTTRLTQPTNGWSDWTDGSERIGVALMLQHGLARGWLTPDVDNVLERWAEFAKAHLMDAGAAPRRGSQDHHAGIRLYDSPWLARFFLLRHAHHGRDADLDLAARLLERALVLGTGRLLTIGFSEVTVAVADALAADGQQERAATLRDAVVDSARYFARLGNDLPGHEVAYEQAIVAPLLNLLIDAHRLTGDQELLDAVGARLPWLLAFGGPQPHARLHGVAIRHWDGYWFGQRRQWGDVFPHYWSALTSTVLLRLPAPFRTDQTDDLAHSILRANMANYLPDGSATCAFVLPTAVDGVPAHTPDPLANDQDFHLALWMQLEADGHVGFD